MRFIIKVSFLIGIACIIAGGILFGVAIKTNAFKRDIITNSYEISEEFNNISIDTKIFDFKIISSESSSNTKIETKETEKNKISYIVEDDTLKINHESKARWIDNISILGSRYTVTITVPSKNFDIIDIKATTSDIKLEGIMANKTTIHNTTGDVRIINTISSDKLEVALTTGDIYITKSDSKDIYLKTTTGDIYGDILTPKKFTANTTTGDRRIPESVENGEICTLKTTTGDIKIKITE